MNDTPIPLPSRVIVRVHGPRLAGVVVDVRFQMRYKNDFSYRVFTDATGFAEASQEMFLASFDADAEFFLMDCGDARRAFTGRVTASIPSTAEMKEGLRWLDVFKKVTPYPDGFEESFRAAVKEGQEPADYHIELEVIYSAEPE